MGTTFMDHRTMISRRQHGFWCSLQLILSVSVAYVWRPRVNGPASSVGILFILIVWSNICPEQCRHFVHCAGSPSKFMPTGHSTAFVQLGGLHIQSHQVSKERRIVALANRGKACTLQ